MAINANSDILASDFINESEADATPANDNGRVPKLESFGGNDRKIHPTFHPQKIEVFDTSGTWTKDENAVRIIVELWGAGASGAHTNNNSTAFGGGGGEYVKFELPASVLASTEAATVGVGGVAVGPNNNGNLGGDSYFGTTVEFGRAKGGGAGTLSGVGSGGNAGVTTLSNPQKESGNNGSTASVVPASKVWAGGGGGTIDGTGPNPKTDGSLSLFGGDGGNANVPGVNGGNGSAPGGAGAGADSATLSGAGANGRIRITTIF